MRKMLVRVAAIATFAFAGLFGVSSPAHAWIGSCSQWQYSDRHVGGYCEGGNGSGFYEVGVCRWSTGDTYYAFGPSEWAGGGQWSVAWCHAGSVLVNYWTVKNE
jgi:hypothetical protein